MPHLKTFAFAHPTTPEQLAPFAKALPEVELLVPGDGPFPLGIERADAVSLHWEHPPIDELLSLARNMRWMHLRGAGIDRVATPALVDSGVIVTNGSGNHAPNIAEHLMAMMLAFARQLPGLVGAQGDREWKPPARKRVFELGGQTLVIVGFGAIGQALAPRAAAFGMDVIGVRRSPAGPLPAGVARVVGMDALDDALALGDHIAVCLPLTGETRGLFGRQRFARIKPDAHFYNVGRGAIVDQDALLQALRSGRLAGAGLDVTDPEPLPADSPLWAEPGVLITAHSAGITPHSTRRWQELLLDNMQRFARGEPLQNIVDVRLGY
jgi:D-2-hydroxyacid dehydrogenase (NADP+)